jgi:hypothetical protein
VWTEHTTSAATAAKKAAAAEGRRLRLTPAVHMFD